MELSELLIIVGLSVGVLLSLSGIVLYIQHYFKQRTEPEQAKGLVSSIGLVNFLICLFMAVVLVGMSLSSYNVFGLQNIFWVIAVLFILFFVFGQSIYVLIPASPFHAQINEPLNRWLRAGKPDEKELEEFERLYLAKLRGDQRLRLFHIINMRKPRAIEEVYIPIKLYYKRTQQTQQTSNETADARSQVPDEEHERQQYYGPEITPEVLLEREQYSVVLGDPGVGKTTFLRHLALQVASGELATVRKVPIYLELNTFASRQQNLLECIIDIVSQTYHLNRGSTERFIKHNLKEGKLLLLFDALDETLVGTTEKASRDRYSQVANDILNFAKTYPRSSIIVTSRAAIYEYDQAPILKNFCELALFGFKEADIPQFLEKWFTPARSTEIGSHVEDLVAMLMDNRRRSLASNPLLLSLIATLYQDGQIVPDYRAQLYQQAVDTLLIYDWSLDTLLDKWDSSRGVIRQGNFGLWEEKQLLQKIAWSSYEEDKYHLSEDTVIKLINEFLSERWGERQQSTQKAREFLEEIVTRHCLLKVVQPSQSATENAKRSYEFLHPSFRAYLAARYVADNDLLSELLRYLGDPAWEEVLYAYEPSPYDMNFLLDQPKYEDIFLTNLIMAGHWIAAVPERLQSQVAKVTDALFKELTQTRYQLMRRRLAETLVEIGDVEINQPEGFTVTRKLWNVMLEQQNSVYGREIAHSVTTALVEKNVRSAANMLLFVLKDSDNNYQVQIEAVHALRMLGRPEQASELLQLLRESSLRDDLGGAIVEALGHLKGDAIWPDLLDLLYNEHLRPRIRCRIIGVLYHLCGHRDEHIADLQKRFTNERLEPLLRGCLLIALCALGQTSFTQSLLDLFTLRVEGVRPGDLIAFLKDIEAYHILLTLLPLLANSYVTFDVRMSIAELLEKLSREFDGRQLVISTLASYMLDERIDLAVRSRITRALGMLSTPGEQDLVEQLMSMLSNARTPLMLRKSSADAIGDVYSVVDEKSSVAPIIARMQQLRDQEVPESSLRRSIVIALGMLGDGSAPTCEALLAMLHISGIQQEQEYMHMLTALENLSKQARMKATLLPRLWEVTFTPGLREKVRDDLIRLIVSVADSEQEYGQACEILLERLLLPDITDAVYDVLWRISHNAHVRIYRGLGTKLHVVER